MSEKDNPPSPSRHPGLPQLDSPHSEPSTQVDCAEDRIPDGGAAAWFVLLGSWSILFSTFGLINSLGAFQSYYEEHLLRGYSVSTIAWIPSLQIFIAYFCNVFSGRLYDYYGPRYLVLGGSVLQVFGIMMTSLSTRYYQLLLAQGLCTSLGISAIFPPATACLAGWFDKKRGMAYGIATSGSSVGGVVLPIMVSRLISQIGFPWAIRSVGFLILGLLTVANLAVKARLPRDPKPFSRKTVLAPFLDLKLMLVNASFLILTFGVFVPLNYIAVEALRHGVSYDLAQYLVATLNAGSLFGRIIAGMAADKVGVYNTFMAASALAGILVLALWIPASGAAAIFVFSILFGFTSGAYIALITPVVVKISPPSEVGYRTGLVFFLSSFGGLVTNPLAGAIVEQWDGDYTGMKIFSGVMLMCGVAVMFLSRMLATHWKVNVIF